jgi:hypothetical protein
VSVLHHPPPSSTRTATGFEAHARSWRIVAEARPEPCVVTAHATNAADQLDAPRLHALFALLAEHYDAAALRELGPYRVMPSVVVGGLGVEVLLPRARRAEFVAALAAILETDTVPEPEVVSPRRRWFRRLFARQSLQRS